MFKTNLWEWIIFGTLFTGLGSYMVITDSEWASWGQFPISAWAGWAFILVGSGVVFICIKNIFRNNNAIPKRPIYTDEDAARAKAELDAMYLREHGTLPEKPEEDA